MVNFFGLWSLCVRSGLARALLVTPSVVCFLKYNSPSIVSILLLACELVEETWDQRKYQGLVVEIQLCKYSLYFTSTTTDFKILYHWKLTANYIKTMVLILLASFT